MVDKYEKILTLEKEIMTCKKCERICLINPFPMPHIYYNRNLDDLKLFLIARNPGIEHDYTDIIQEKYLEIYHKNWYICNIALYFKNIFGEETILKNMFFTNICKCSSPNNSSLNYNEISNCKTYLDKQIEIIQPKLILTFGKEAKQHFLIKKDNNKVFHFYHPSYFNYVKNDTLKLRQENTIRNLIKNL